MNLSVFQYMNGIFEYFTFFCIGILSTQEFVHNDLLSGFDNDSKFNIKFVIMSNDNAFVLC